MIYLVSSNRSLFNSDKYEYISPEHALELLKKEKILGADTETEGLDPYTKKLLTVQLGNEYFQIVWDCTTVDVLMLKPILEDPNIKTIWWNCAFDFLFLYKVGIYPENVYDGMVAEELMYLGYPAGMHSMSLKSAGKFYCDVELDKTARGKIITQGLNELTIIYSANDVKYEIPIYKKQQKLLEEKDLIRAIKCENEFVKVLAYIKFCGVKLDVSRWKAKMDNDQKCVELFKKSLDNWIIASEQGTGSCICYIDTFGRKERDIKKDREYYKNNRVKEEDIEYHGHLFEAYRVDVPKTKFPTKVYHYDYQGDLFSGYSTDPICDINWSSSKQVIPLLKILGFETKEFDTKEKKYKDSASGKVIAKQLDKCSIALSYCKYKLWKKKTESFGQTYLDAINPVTGRIHTNFYILGTDTARVSSGGKPYNINLQQLPRDKETRACFIAEKGNKWVSADYDG